MQFSKEKGIELHPPTTDKLRAELKRVLEKYPMLSDTEKSMALVELLNEHLVNAKCKSIN